MPVIPKVLHQVDIDNTRKRSLEQVKDYQDYKLPPLTERKGSWIDNKTSLLRTQINGKPTSAVIVEVDEEETNEATIRKRTKEEKRMRKEAKRKW
jgi:hypothetical protein